MELPQGFACLIPPCNEADFCREGSSHFRSEQIWKLIWNEPKIIAWSTLLALYLHWMIIQIQYSMILLACAGAAETMPSHSP